MASLFTSEQVSCGHPDKMCDLISDSILTECLRQDKNSRVAVETLMKNYDVIVAGEVTTKATLDIDKIVHRVLKYIGVDDVNKYKIINLIDKQSPDIAMGVDIGGAGDQGIMFGYACRETAEMMPLAWSIANKSLINLRELKHPLLKPDAKSQVTIDYENNRIDTFLISTQHSEKISNEELYSIVTKVMQDTALEYNMNTDFKILINPTGRFVIGGSIGDAGITGRKIIADTYGGYAKHGGGAFCVDKETEFLTPNGWKKMNEYKEGDLIAQWNDGILEFVKPFAYINQLADKMYSFKSHSIDMVLSQNHDIVMLTSKGNLIKKRAKDIIDKDLNIKNGNHGEIPVAFKFFKDKTSVKLTNDEIRLQVAFCADGTIRQNGTSRIRIKKQYKKDNLEYLLKSTNTKYHISKDGDFNIYYFEPPIKSKSLIECFKDCDSFQYEIIANELFQWDGNRENIYRTTNKDDADFAQFILMSTTGKSVSINIDDRVGELNRDKYIRKSIYYEVTLKKNSTHSIRRSANSNVTNKIIIDEFVPNDGKMYCFTVPTGILILRRNNNVFITGNSGKDPTKVDRSAAYMARYLAKYTLECNPMVNWCEIQLSYAIGVAEPVSVHVLTDLGEMSNDFIIDSFDLTPKGIIKFLNLKNIDYTQTTCYGHFGKKDLPWEKVEYEELSVDDNIFELDF